MDIGRNDPCPCGSGKKYKRCCGAPKTDPLELAAGVVRGIQDAAEAKVVRLVRDMLGDDALSEAWEAFQLEGSDLDPERDEEDLFVPWALYDWEPWDPERYTRRPREIRFTPAAGAVAGRGAALTPAESDFLLRVLVSPTTFHDVVRAEPGRTVTLRDVFLGTELTVFEKLGSTGVRPGDILYARVVPFDDVALVIGSGQVVIPPRHKGFVLDAKSSLRRRPGKLDAPKLCREEPLLRSFYLGVREDLIRPPAPVMCNTDGDRLEFHTLSYRIDDAEAAFDALAPLAHDLDRGELLADAKRDPSGTLRHVELPWTRTGNAKHGGMPSTTLANFTIGPKMLTASVNSAERAKSVRSEIETRLGKRATFSSDKVQSLEDAMSERADKPETARERAERRRDEELQSRPEIQEMIAKMNADHYATWPDVPLPALKGKTPRAAMRTAEGRERVEALLVDFERSQDPGRSRMPHYDFNQLRALLGLPLRRT